MNAEFSRLAGDVLHSPYFSTYGMTYEQEDERRAEKDLLFEAVRKPDCEGPGDLDKEARAVWDKAYRAMVGAGQPTPKEDEGQAEYDLRARMTEPVSAYLVEPGE